MKAVTDPCPFCGGESVGPLRPDAGAAGCASFIVVPHSPQNFCFSALSAPQLGHLTMPGCGSGRGTVDSICESASASASPNSSALPKRCAGSFASAMRHTSARSEGI